MQFVTHWPVISSAELTEYEQADELNFLQAQKELQFHKLNANTVLHSLGWARPQKHSWLD